MHQFLLRPALLMGLALAAVGFAPPAAAQSAPSAAPTWTSLRPTASTTPSADVSETAGRRRPTRRSVAHSSRPDTIIAVSSRARGSAGTMSAERSAMVTATLLDAGRPWLGTPYRWGGQTRRGIDCSAFVQQFMRDNLGVDLPRATAGQQYEGVPVSKADLLPGDLVFFRLRSVRHVGVYLGGGEFIHASSSRGVTVSDLTEGYYQNTYWMSRRVVSAPSGRRPTPRQEARRSDADSAGVRG